MIRRACFLLNILFFLNCEASLSQNITGTWEGTMGMEYLQLNIIQKNNELCGYTYDYYIGNPAEYCKAYFNGRYDAEQGAWLLIGTTFIEKSSSHILMRIKIWANDKSGNVLYGRVYSKDASVSLINEGSGDLIKLRKVPMAPRKNPDYLSSCFPKKIIPKPPLTSRRDTIKRTVPLTKGPAVAKPRTSKPKPLLVAKTPVRPDTLKKQVAPRITPRNVPAENSATLIKMNSRKKGQLGHLEVDVKNIKLSVYDNGIEDNDTVSIFYNGRLLAGKKLLSEKPLELYLELDEFTTLHEITMFAENLGSIPPNTALIVVTAGKQRYELHSKASLEENAVLVFEYHPKRE